MPIEHLAIVIVLMAEFVRKRSYCKNLFLGVHMFPQAPRNQPVFVSWRD